MLDEVLEYKSYTDSLYTKIETKKKGKTEYTIFSRLSDNLILAKNKLVGISRPLIIIARHLLKEKGYFEKETKKEQKELIIEEIKKELSSWCFADEEHNPCHYRQTLHEYLSEIHKGLSNSIKENSVITNFLKPKTENWYYNKWNGNIYDAFFSDGKCSPCYSPVSKFIYTVNFSAIIADAINLGELKSYVMLCNKTFLEDLIKDRLRFDPKKSIYSYPSASFMTSLDRILKLIAAYLLCSKSYKYVSDSVQINKIDLSNWMHFDNYGRGKETLNIFSYKSEDDYTGSIADEHYSPVFNDRYSLLCLNDRSFFNKYNFEIKEKKEWQNDSSSKMKEENSASKKDLICIYETEKSFTLSLSAPIELCKRTIKDNILLNHLNKDYHSSFDRYIIYDEGFFKYIQKADNNSFDEKEFLYYIASFLDLIREPKLKMKNVKDLVPLVLWKKSICEHWPEANDPNYNLFTFNYLTLEGNTSPQPVFLKCGEFVSVSPDFINALSSVSKELNSSSPFVIYSGKTYKNALKNDKNGSDSKTKKLKDYSKLSLSK